MVAPFPQLTSDFGTREWRLLEVLASERRIAPSMLERLASTENERAPLRQWLQDALSRGLLVDAGVVHSLTASRSAARERALAIRPEFRPLVLRRLRSATALDAAREAGRAVAGDDSLSAFVTALYGGDLSALKRALPALGFRFPDHHGAAFAKTLLREALCISFDGDWLQSTWRGSAHLLAEQVLADALATFEPVSELADWAMLQLETPAAMPVSFLRTLAEHALLRAETPLARRIAEKLSPPERAAFEIALRYVEGDLESALRAFAELSPRKLDALGSVSVRAILALLALHRSAPEDLAFARRILHGGDRERAPIPGFAAPGVFAGAGRAVRLLLRYLTEPETERARLDVHQFPPDTAAWELLISGLIVHLHERSDVTRAGWSRRLSEESRRIHAGGYAWFARQAETLAAALAPDLGKLDALPAIRPGELLLHDLIQPRPAWRKALDALTGLAKATDSSPVAANRRVAWFVDMANGRLGRPALEEYHAGTGWSQVSRVDLEELMPSIAELPPEDAAVLGRLRAEQEGAKREGRSLDGLALGDLVLEALVGHPRVFNGARGRQPVDVVRGTARVETRREHGHLVVQVEPAGASLGLNVVVSSETRLVVYRITKTMAKVMSLVPAGVRVPETHADELLPVLAELAEHVEVRSAELGVERALAADATPCVRISPDAGAWWLEIGVRPFGERGRFFPAGYGRERLASYTDGLLLRTERDLREERRRALELVDVCPTLRRARDVALEQTESQAEDTDSPPVHVTLDEEGLLTLLGELRDSGVACALEWKNSAAVRARGVARAASLRGSLRCVKGWYLVTGGVSIDSSLELSLQELVELPFTKSGRFVRLRTGDYVELEDRVRRTVALLRAQGQPSARAVQLPDASTGVVRMLIDAAPELSVDDSAKALLERVQSVEAREYTVHEGLRATLRPYQLEGYRWLCRWSDLGFGVCLADDMGLGKTLQMIALLLRSAEQGPALVVAPTSVCRNWIDELGRFAPSLRAAEFEAQKRNEVLESLRTAATETEARERGPDVLVVSYALLQQHAAAFASVPWNIAVLDEAQFIKNANSLRAKAAFALSARQRIALSGTPVENHLGDLWSVFHFLNPTLLGTFKEFQVRFLNPIERDRDSERNDALKQRIQPFVLRRRKHEVLTELPPITVVNHGVVFSEEEAVRYALLRREIHTKLRTSAKRHRKLEVFAEIMRLRRFCCHPRLVFPDAGSESSKLLSFLELAEELRDNGHRALVFSQFVDFLDLVREQLDERGIRYSYLDGSTPKSSRKRLVDEFQNGNAELFLISLKAGGFGLNLTAADYVIHLDPWWNPAVEAQATDRAHRIGQTEKVTVYRLICKDSIEERILALHAQKRELADAVLDGTDQSASFDPEELVALLGVP